MRSRLSNLALSVLLAPLGVASPVLAENLVFNHGFDSDVSPWIGPGLSWSAEDEHGDPASGSARFEVGPGFLSVLFSDCFPLTGGERLVHGASAALEEGLDPGAGHLRTALRFYDEAGCMGELEDTPLSALRASAGYAGWGPIQGTTAAPGWARSARLGLWAASLGDLPQTFRIDNAYVHSGSSCAATGTVLCLQGERFRVTANYQISDGSRGYAGVRPLSGDSAYLWFFSSSNLELVIKVLDGCGSNDHYWIYAAGLTNLGVELRVTDTLSGESWSFDNPVDEAFPPRQDIEAFAACGLAPAAPEL